MLFFELLCRTANAPLRLPFQIPFSGTHNEMFLIYLISFYRNNVCHKNLFISNFSSRRIYFFNFFDLKIGDSNVTNVRTRTAHC